MSPGTGTDNTARYADRTARAYRSRRAGYSSQQAFEEYAPVLMPILHKAGDWPRNARRHAGYNLAS